MVDAGVGREVLGAVGRLAHCGGADEDDGLLLLMMIFGVIGV